jgi:hypothetical protein
VAQRRRKSYYPFTYSSIIMKNLITNTPNIILGNSFSMPLSTAVKLIDIKEINSTAKLIQFMEGIGMIHAGEIAKGISMAGYLRSTKTKNGDVVYRCSVAGLNFVKRQVDLLNTTNHGQEDPYLYMAKIGLSIDDVVFLMNDDVYNTPSKILKFLKDSNIVSGMMPQPELLKKEYMDVFSEKTSGKKCGKMVNVLRFSRAGLEYLHRYIQFVRATGNKSAVSWMEVI